MMASSLVRTAIVAGLAATMPALPASAASTASADQATTQELSRRSGIPASELAPMLAACEADQQHMQFCAWRDQIDAERQLTEALREQRVRSPRCAQAAERRAAAQVARLSQQCTRSSAREWGEGSLRETARLNCLAAGTQRLAQRVRRADACADVAGGTSRSAPAASAVPAAPAASR